jgi:hypothetical protein
MATQIFKLTVTRTRVLQYSYQDEVEAEDIHEAAKILRERVDGENEAPDTTDILDDSTRITAVDGVGNVWDVS